MGLFNYLKKSLTESKELPAPYSDSATNLLYNQLFCDRIDLYKQNATAPFYYPFDILFSETSSVIDLQRILDDRTSDPRIKILAYNKQLASYHTPSKKELLAVIVEIALENGLDVLASFHNGAARYINHNGNIFIWEISDKTSDALTAELFSKSREIIRKIGPSDKARYPHPSTGNLRITFLVSDGLYFGEGPITTLFNDPMASPALNAATQLLNYLTEKQP